MDNYNCINYYPTFIDLFVPSYQIIYKFCLSTDKTKLFLISLSRLCLWIMIFTGLIGSNNIGRDNNTIIFFILLTYIVVNLIYIIILIFKKPALDKSVMDNISNEIAKSVKSKPLTLPTLI